MMKNPEYGEFEHDPFIDGLELGMWDEGIEYYIPVSEWRIKNSDGESPSATLDELPPTES